MCNAVLLTFWVIIFFNSLCNAQEESSITKEVVYGSKNNTSFRSSFLNIYNTPWENFHFNYTKWDDFLNTVPGIVARDYGSPTISIRGSQQLGRVLQLYNDIPLNGPDGFGASRLFMAKEMTDSLETIKGPSSLLYGTQALAGSMNFKTQAQPNSIFKVTISDYSDLLQKGNSLGQYSLSVRTDLIKKPYNSLQISFLNENDIGDFKYKDKNTNSFNRRINNKNSLSRVVIYGKQKVDSWTLEENIILAKSYREIPGSTILPLLSLEDSLGYLTSLQAKYNYSEKTDYGIQLSNIKTEALYDKNTNSESFLKNSRFFILQNISIKYFSWLHTKIYLDYYHDSFSSTYANSTEFIKDTYEYAKAFEVFITESLAAEIGSRYSFNDKKTTSSAIIKNQHNLNKTWVGFTQGYRMPSLTDRYSNTNFFQANPNLKNETSDQLEVGYSFNEMKSEPGLNATIDIFWLKYKDDFTTLPLSPTLNTKINSAGQENWGADLNLEYKTSTWSSNLQYSFIQSLLGSRLRLTPSHSLRVGYSYKFDIFYFGLFFDYWSDYYDLLFPSNSLNRVGDWKSLDFITSALIDERTKLEFGIKNIFDYQFERTFGYPEPGRRFYLTLNHFF